MSMSHATELLMWGLVCHLVADWLLQNDWMAANKANLRHPAAWAHGGTYALAMALVFPWPAAALLGLAHVAIDTRKPLSWWRVRFGQIRDESALSMVVAIWNDQALHIALMAMVAIGMAAWEKGI